MSRFYNAGLCLMRSLVGGEGKVDMSARTRIYGSSNRRTCLALGLALVLAVSGSCAGAADGKSEVSADVEAEAARDLKAARGEASRWRSEAEGLRNRLQNTSLLLKRARERNRTMKQNLRYALDQLEIALADLSDWRTYAKDLEDQMHSETLIGDASCFLYEMNC